MFCPQCATANAEQSKFCRACGTNLEIVALALAGQLAPPSEAGEGKGKRPRTRDEWLGKWGNGVRETVQGSVLLAVYLLVGFSLLAFLPEWRVDSILMWFVLAGAMAVWGIILLARGIGHIVEAKPRLHELERMAGGSMAAAPPRLSEAHEWRMTSGNPTAPELVRPPSVTEHTTQQLDYSHAPQPEVVLPKNANE